MNNVTLNYVGSIPALVNINPSIVFPCGDAAFAAGPIFGNAPSTYRIFGEILFPFGQFPLSSTWFDSAAGVNWNPGVNSIPQNQYYKGLNFLRVLFRNRDANGVPLAPSPGIGAVTNGLPCIFDNGFINAAGIIPAAFTGSGFGNSIAVVPFELNVRGTQVAFMGYRDTNNIYVAIDTWFTNGLFSSNIMLYDIGAAQYVDIGFPEYGYAALPANVPP